jgi:hypothetical protein
MSGARQLVLSTQQTTKLEENISNLFGSKFLSSLMNFQLGVTKDDLNKISRNCEEEIEEAEGDKDDEKQEGEKPPVEDHQPEETAKADTAIKEEDFKATITGWVSKAGIGVGRSDNDRQYVFCNGRPVDLPKFSKALNEIWRKYEMKQKPAFIVDLRISKGSIDVNVTPDKREIILKNENIIIDKLKLVVDELYSPSRSTFVANHPVLITSFLQSQNIEVITPMVKRDQREFLTSESSQPAEESQESPRPLSSVQQSESVFLSQEEIDSQPLLQLSQNQGTPERIEVRPASNIPTSSKIWSSPIEKIRLTASSSNFSDSKVTQPYIPYESTKHQSFSSLPSSSNERKRSFQDSFSKFASFSQENPTPVKIVENKSSAGIRDYFDLTPTSAPSKHRRILEDEEEEENDIEDTRDEIEIKKKRQKMDQSESPSEAEQESEAEAEEMEESINSTQRSRVSNAEYSPMEDPSVPEVRSPEIVPMNFPIPSTNTKKPVWHVNPNEIFRKYQMKMKSKVHFIEPKSQRVDENTDLIQEVSKNLEDENYKTLQKEVSCCV